MCDKIIDRKKNKKTKIRQNKMRWNVVEKKQIWYNDISLNAILASICIGVRNMFFNGYAWL